MIKISNSVGRRGVNVSSDVVIVKTLLNRHIVPPAELLKVSGTVDPKTVNAIVAFQRWLGMKNCDGRVDPGRKTFRALLTVPKSVPVKQTHHFSFSDIPKVLSGWVMNGPIGSLIKNYLQKPAPVLRPAGTNAIAWGAKVSPEFKKRVIEICQELEINPDYLMSCMAFESMETFRADIPNKAGSGAIGLIQFMPNTAVWLNTTTDALAEMTPVAQLEYVRKYFLSYKGKLKTLEDLYMAILWPKAIGKDPDKAIFKAGTKAYKQNKGFDKHNVGEITPRMCADALHKAYKKGLSKGYFG